ncbi:hypothetical protein S245_017617, partial [Arachis hypogaea]
FVQKMVRRKVVATDECTGTSGETFQTSTHFQKHDLYTWVVEEVKNTPSTIIREHLDELKGSGVIFTFDDVERDIIHTLLGLWNDNPLDLRMILAEVQASKNVV